MTICALLLARQFYDLQPSRALKYATLGLLFVNVSIGGTLTHFAAPPVLMVARPWEWDTAFMLGHFGWRAALAIVASTLVYYLVFRRELRALALAARGARCDAAGAGGGRLRPGRCRFRGGSPPSTCCSSSGPSSTRTIRRCSWRASCSSWASIARRRRTRRCPTSRRRCSSASSSPAWSSTAGCRRGGSRRCSRA